MALISTGLELPRRPRGPAAACGRSLMSTPVTHAIFETEGDGTTEKNKKGKRKKNRVFLFHEKSRTGERKGGRNERVELERSD